MLAMSGYGLNKGGLKNAVMDGLTRKTAARAAAPRIHALIAGGMKITAAARLTAIERRIGDPSRDTLTKVVERLIRAYREWNQRGQGPSDDKSVGSLLGDTGRYLRVRFHNPWLGPNNEPIDELLGVKFGPDGFGIAPDSCEWRRLIAHGHIALHGIINAKDV